MAAYYAHSGKQADKFDWQPLDEHLAGVSALAEEMARPLRLAEAARLAGWLHDAGKYTAAFQRRLEGGVAVDHSTAGAKIALDLAPPGQRRVAELVAYAVLGHHAGLPNRDDASDSSFEARLESHKRAPAAIPERELLPLLGSVDFGALPPQTDAFGLSLLGRMLFSCLVDADFKDTERFYARLDNKSVDREWPELRPALPELKRRFDDHMVRKPADGSLNALRRDILSHVRGRASGTPGLFTLTHQTSRRRTVISLVVPWVRPAA